MAIADKPRTQATFARAKPGPSAHQLVNIACGAVCHAELRVR